jgi:hypothetical protein
MSFKVFVYMAFTIGQFYPWKTLTLDLLINHIMDFAYVL